MAGTRIRELDFSRLEQGLPGVSREVVAAFFQAAKVCLANQNHADRVQLTRTGAFAETFALRWKMPSKQTLATWSDLSEAVEMGACAIAFMLTLEVTDYTVIQRSRKGTGFDYWLGKKNDIPFQNSARLEISGILCGDSRSLDRRVAMKQKQIQRSDATMIPGFVVVVEFSAPTSKMVKK